MYQRFPGLAGWVTSTQAPLQCFGRRHYTTQQTYASVAPSPPKAGRIGFPPIHISDDVSTFYDLNDFTLPRPVSSSNRGVSSIQ